MNERPPEEPRYDEELYRAYHDRFEVLMKKVTKDKQIEPFMNDLVVKSKELIEKYPDYMDYALWHVMASSTIGFRRDRIKDDDFPGKDSIAKFIGELEYKYIYGPLLQEYKDRVGALMFTLMEEESDDPITSLMADLDKKKKSLIDKYGSECNRYALFHVLGGSSIKESEYGSLLAGDFPEEDSVAGFVIELEEKYSGEKDLQK